MYSIIIYRNKGDMMLLSEIKGLGPSGINSLKKLNILTCDDLVSYYPFRYNVLKRSNIDILEQDDKIIIDGTIDSLPSIYFINKRMDKMTFKLNTGKKLINVLIFNRAFLKNKLTLNSNITLLGKYDKKHNTIVASDIRFGLLSSEPKIEPIYHSISGFSNKKIQNLCLQILDSDYIIDDYIPTYFVNKYNLMDKKCAIKNIHNPLNVDVLKASINRLKYEELFIFMLKMNYLKNQKGNINGITRTISYNYIKDFINNLPFPLTGDQTLAVKQIYEDMISEKTMNRLVQGDVGSGKTIVAICAMYINYLSGYQSAMMAPTEILAIQHYETAKKIFSKYDIKIALITGKTKKLEKNKIYKDLVNGNIDIIIGTHSLITEKIEYKNLGLVITDEQHRFGVHQRGILKSKGITPDILYMSATPIPRTYALTVYGDMDVSNIKTMPNGRKKIQTFLKSEKEMEDVLMMMYGQLRENHQIYVVAPLIEDSEKSDFESINDLYDKMNKAFGNKYKIGILHGKLKNNEKEAIMNDFKNNDIQILVATTVIEVGVDVSNATMIVIFDAFRFGLSTLHQLRGRVGRNNLQSYCLLVSSKETKRLNVLVETNDGFKISEEDFLLRGSGDLFGVRQSGDMIFKLSDLRKDYKLLLKAKEDSEMFLKENLLSCDDMKIKELIDNCVNLD